MKLTRKQQLFVDEYLVDLNGTQAAIRAGYSPKSANRLANETLSKPYIQQRINQRLREKEEALIMKQDEILKLYSSIARGEQMSTDYLGVGHGEQKLIERKPTTNERLKALDSLAKVNSMFIDRQDLNITLPQFIEDVPDDD